MSLSKVKTKVKAGVKEVQSVQGLKRVALDFGVGVALGAIVDLILAAIMINIIEPTFGKKATRLYGFSIFPNFNDTNPDTGKEEPYMPYDDILQIVITLLLLTSKKFWLVIGYFVGFYSASYTGMYYVLGLPTPETGT